MDPNNDIVNELLDLFDEMLKLAEQELEWFNTNTPGNGDTDQLLTIATNRHSLATRIDDRRSLLGQQKGLELSEDLNKVMSKILAIDNHLQIKASEWMQDLKGKMQKGKTVRQANKAYGGGDSVPGAAFFDGKR